MTPVKIKEIVLDEETQTLFLKMRDEVFEACAPALGVEL